MASLAVYRTANELIEQHGEDATIHAATQLQMVRFSHRSGHWASVCLLSGVKRTEINGPQNFRS